MDKMDNLKIQGIFPSSISEISYNNQQSDFTYSIPNQHQTQKQQKLADYQIKINTPDNRQLDLHANNDGYEQQKWEKFEKQVSKNNASNNNIMPRSQWIEYTDKVSGYELNRYNFSQEQILKAFNTIDITKDDMISEDDLVFVLDYIKQDYTMEEVREMIMMLSSDKDKKYVNFQEFKKLGRGQVIPLAKFDVDERRKGQGKGKGKILESVVGSELLQEDPEFLVQCLKKDEISYRKFEQVRKGAKQTVLLSKTAESQKKPFTLGTLYSKAQLKERKQIFSKIVLTNIDQLIKNYNEEYKDDRIGLQKISLMLQISLKEVRQLYPNLRQTDMSSLQVIMQVVSHSRQKIVNKLETALQLVNNRKQVSLQQLVHILQILKGKDQSLDKKVRAIVGGRGVLGKNGCLGKNVAYEIVLEYMAVLMG